MKIIDTHKSLKIFTLSINMDQYVYIERQIQYTDSCLPQILEIRA